MSGLFALVVEDDGDQADLFARALQTVGFETEIMPDGDRAQAWLDGIVPDVVLLDLHIPGVPGTDVLRRIRGDERLAQVRVIVVTGDPLTAENYRDQIDLILIKPIDFDQLCNLATRLASPM